MRDKTLSPIYSSSTRRLGDKSILNPMVSTKKKKKKKKNNNNNNYKQLHKSTVS